MKSRTTRMLALPLALALTASAAAVATAQDDAADPAEPVAVSVRSRGLPVPSSPARTWPRRRASSPRKASNVTIHPGGFDTNSITLVAAGTDTFGMHDTNSLVFAAVEDIPLVTVATFLQKHPGAIMALAEKGYETLEDLVGARIGFQEGGPWVLTQAMLVKNGIDSDSLDQVTSGFDLTPLLEGQIDLQTVFATTEPIIADSLGVETTVFVPYDYGVETSANAPLHSQAIPRGEPRRRVQHGPCHGPRLGVRLREPRRSGGDRGRVDPDNLDLEVEKKMIAAMDSAVRTPDAIENGIGSMTAERWQTTVDVLRDFGGLEADVDLDSVYSDICFAD